MNVEIETEATQFSEKEYVNGISVAACTVSHYLRLQRLAVFGNLLFVFS